MSRLSGREKPTVPSTAKPKPSPPIGRPAPKPRSPPAHFPRFFALPALPPAQPLPLRRRARPRRAPSRPSASAPPMPRRRLPPRRLLPPAEKAYRAALATAPTERHRAPQPFSLPSPNRTAGTEAAAAHAAVALRAIPPPANPSARNSPSPRRNAGHVPAPLAAFLTPGPLHQLASAWNPPLRGNPRSSGPRGGFFLSLGFIVLHAYPRAPLGPLAYRPLRRAHLLRRTRRVRPRRLAHLRPRHQRPRRHRVARRHASARSRPKPTLPKRRTPLAAGSLAIVDQTFLGWRHLIFPTGQSGWVRAEDLVVIVEIASVSRKIPSVARGDARPKELCSNLFQHLQKVTSLCCSQQAG